MREPDATKLFIGQVPRDWSEEQLREVLEPFGEIHSLTLLMDKATGQHKGCAFLTYFDNASAKSAQEELHEKKTLPGARNPLKVQPAESEEDNRKLFIGMLSKTYDVSDLKEMFAPHGTIEDCTILKNSDGGSRGCAFIKYETRLQAQNAINSIHGSQVMEGNTKSIVVKHADTDKDKLNKKRLQTGPGMNVPSAASGVLNAMAPYQQQTAYYQQLLALPQIIAANPSLAAAPATPGTIGALVAAMSAQSQQQQQPLNQQQSSLQPEYRTANYASNASYNTASAVQNPTSLLGGYSYNNSLASPAVQQLPQKQTSGPEGANLFVYQIPSEFSDSDLQQTFQPFGNVVSAKVFVDKVTGYSKGFGFVSYDNASSANTAIASMNGAVIGSKRLKVQLKRSKEQSSKPY